MFPNKTKLNKKRCDTLKFVHTNEIACNDAPCGLDKGLLPT